MHINGIELGVLPGSEDASPLTEVFRVKLLGADYQPILQLHFSAYPSRSCIAYLLGHLQPQGCRYIDVDKLYTMQNPEKQQVVNAVFEPGGKQYAWVNPMCYKITPGSQVLADTRSGPRLVQVISVGLQGSASSAHRSILAA